MKVSSVNNMSYQPQAGGAGEFAKVVQAFKDMGSALDSGNLSDAKSAFAQLQKVAPQSAADGTNSMDEKLKTLAKALDSGDLKAAKSAYSDIQKTRTPAGEKPPGGAPPGGGAPSSALAGSSSSSSAKIYDKADANEDGTVSTKEQIAYDLAHPKDEETSSVLKQSGTGRVSLNVFAWHSECHLG